MKSIFWLFAAALLARGLCLRACDDEDRVAFSDWNYASPATGKPFPYIAYTVRRTGFHAAEIHFKNFASKDISFDFWLPGYQRSGASTSVRVPVSAPNDREWIVPINLACGASGARFSQLKMANIKMEGQSEKLAAGVPAVSLQVPAADGEAWMSIVPGQKLVEFSPESVACRVVHDASGDRVLFRNTSRENVYFDFRVMGYQSADQKDNPRVRLAVGQEQSAPVKLNHPDDLVSLARVKAFDIRINGDCGTFLDEKDAEEGWFTVSAVNCPTINPNQIVYRIASIGGGKAAIRFKNISRLAVQFKYGIANHPILDEVKIPAESETVVTTGLIESAVPASLIRIRVSEVHYGDSGALQSSKHETIPR